MEEIEIKLKSSLSILPSGGNTIYVACSGGLDSMTLLHALRSVAHSSYKINALHVNYGLRGEESDGDQKLVEKYCCTHDVNLNVLDLRESSKPSKGVQAWARERRYHWFNSQLQKAGDVIALAHHQNDLAENIVFRLTRGYNSQLSGMKVLSSNLWRPFLGLSKQAIYEYASRQKIPYREDSSNVKMTYTRNRIRHKIIGELETVAPGSTARLCEAAKEIDDMVEYIDTLGKGLLINKYLKKADLQVFPEAVAKRYIMLYLSRSKLNCSVQKELINQIWESFTAENDTRIDLNGEYSVILKSGQLEVVTKSSSKVRASQYKTAMEVHNLNVVPEGTTVEYEAKKTQKG